MRILLVDDEKHIVMVLKEYLHSYSNSNKALEILSERFAKGEIDLEEYTHRKGNLLH